MKVKTYKWSILTGANLGVLDISGYHTDEFVKYMQIMEK